jgi:hypothetical protein
MDIAESESSERLQLLHRSYRSSGLTVPEAAEYLELGTNPLTYQGLPVDQIHDIELGVNEVRRAFPPVAVR